MKEIERISKERRHSPNGSSVSTLTLLKDSSFCVLSQKGISTLNCQQSEHGTAGVPVHAEGRAQQSLRVALAAQRNRQDGEQGVEEPLPGVQTLTDPVAHSDVLAPPFSSTALWEPL